jgi:hypothetical protein
MTQTVLPPQVDIVSSLGEFCDRCAAGAKLQLTLPGGGHLLFCGHHANRHADDILRQAVQVTVEAGFAWQGSDRTAR